MAGRSIAGKKRECQESVDFDYVLVGRYPICSNVLEDSSSPGRKLGRLN
jgi:hypothetical protein